MVSGIRFFGGSGSLGGTLAGLYAAGHAEPLIEIFNFEARATNSPERLGFFGLLGPSTSPVVVGLYQDRTARTNDFGTDFGIINNVKYTGASTAEVSGVPFTAGLTNIPSHSGTLLLRFREPNDSAVQTQNAIFRAINMTAGSGFPDISTLATNITLQAAQLADTNGYAGNTSWTQISNGGSTLVLQDQTQTNKIHDYHLIVSASPQAAGRKTDFAFYASIEFL